MRLMRAPRRALLGGLSTLALLAMTSFPVQAQDELIIVEPALTTTYLNGGIGEGDERYMRKIAKDWSLRMMFSERKDDEFVADVTLLVTDTHGVPYLQLSDAGPMTYAMLPAGKYRITAQFRGRSETREVTLDGKTGRDMYFHWKGDAN